jgi:hypothetical protein
MYPKNAASPPSIAIGAVVQISDGTVQTSGVTVYHRTSGTTESAGGGTTSVGATTGVIYYTPTQAETNYESFELVAFKAGCVPAVVTVVTSASATSGYAGADWSKVTNPTSTVGLTNTTVGTVTNLTNERGKYAMGSVWIGPSANTNTVSYTDGIITNPVSTIAAAKTIADALNMRRFEVIRTGTVQVGADLAGYRVSGVGWSLTTTGGSRDVGTTAFLGAQVVGGTFASTTGTINWERCEFSTGVTIGVSNVIESRFQGTMTLSTAGNYDFVDCASVVAGTAAPEFAIPSGTVNVSFRRWSGGIKITGITSGTTVSIDMVSGGTVTLEGADGNVQVRGMTAGITDSRTGSPTLGQNAAINMTKINTEADTALSDVNLDHLAGTATGIPAVPAGTYLDQIMDDGTATYDRTTDSLQAIKDAGSGATVNVTTTTTIIESE